MLERHWIVIIAIAATVFSTGRAGLVVNVRLVEQTDVIEDAAVGDKRAAREHPVDDEVTPEVEPEEVTEEPVVEEGASENVNVEEEGEAEREKRKASGSDEEDVDTEVNEDEDADEGVEVEPVQEESAENSDDEENQEGSDEETDKKEASAEGGDGDEKREAAESDEKEEEKSGEDEKEAKKDDGSEDQKSSEQEVTEDPLDEVDNEDNDSSSGRDPDEEDNVDEDETQGEKRDVAVNVDVSVEEEIVDEESLGEKREVPQSPLDDKGQYLGPYDPECSETLTISPRNPIAKIDPEKHILKKGKTTCHYNIIGTSDCVVQLKCDKFRLEDPRDDPDDPCRDEYLEVTDGTRGFQKFCGKDFPDTLTSGRKLRDFYVTLQLQVGEDERRELRCTAVCSPGTIVGEPLDEPSYPDVNEDCKCGQRPVSAKEGEFPWMATLVGVETRKPFCGGSIINNKFVLTAASCLTGRYIKAEHIEVLLNANELDAPGDHVAQDGSDSYTSHDIAEADRRDNTSRYKIKKYFVHPLYDAETNDYDIALLKLDNPWPNFEELKGVGPVCIPRNGHHTESPQGLDVLVSGFGLNTSDSLSYKPVLQKSELTILEDNDCLEHYDVRYTSRMLCAEATHKENLKKSCEGDVGGPLVFESERNSKPAWEQLGVLSFGEDCSKNGIPSVYSSLRQVSQWIRYISNLEEATWCHGD